MLPCAGSGALSAVLSLSRCRCSASEPRVPPVLLRNPCCCWSSSDRWRESIWCAKVLLGQPQRGRWVGLLPGCTQTTPAAELWAQAPAQPLEEDEGVSAAAAEGHSAEHNEVIGSSVVSLGPDERSVCLGVCSPELGRGSHRLHLHFGGRAATLLG